VGIDGGLWGTGPLPPLNGGGRGPQAVQTLSAGHGVHGYADVVAKAGDGSLWEEETGGIYNWQELLGPRQVLSYATVDGGRVFAIFSDHTLHQFTPGSGWSLMPTPGTVQSLDAVTNKFGPTPCACSMATTPLARSPIRRGP
jgi:hypothetical protein